MGKVKAALNEGDAATAAPIEGAGTATAPTPEPAIVVFGKDEAGKAHAAWFSAVEGELAIKAAGLMSMQVLPITTDDMRVAASGLAAGRIFASGRAFAPFVKESAYTALAAFDGAYAPLAPVAPEPEPLVAATSIPAAWADITVGSAVLASSGSEEGWWPSVVTEDRGEGLYVLRWQGFEEEPTFVRRHDDLGLLPPSMSLAELTGESAEDGADVPAAA